MSTTLDTEVRELLDKRRGTWSEVVRDCDVSHSWVSQFVRGKITNPGYATLVKLHAYLMTAERERPMPAREKAGA